MYCATVVKLQIKSEDSKRPFLKKLFYKNPHLTLCQKRRMKKCEFPEKVPFQTSPIYVKG